MRAECGLSYLITKVVQSNVVSHTFGEKNDIYPSEIMDLGIVLVRVTIAAMKSLCTERSHGRNSHCTGTWSQELVQRPGGCAAFRLLLHGLLSVLSC